MKVVSKYNLFKAISTVLTVGTPITVLALCDDMFIHRSDTAISAAAAFTLLICALFFKDKLAEKFKCPSAFIVSTIVLVLTLIVENIAQPIKYVCIATMVSCGIDELSFKRMYKLLELQLPYCADSFKHLGFVFTTTEHLESLDGESRRNPDRG